MKQALLLSLTALALGTLAQAAPAPSLDGDWRLVRLTDGGRLQAVPVRSAPTLHAEGARVSGSAGCNRYSGSLKVAGAKLSFGPLATTMMACPDYLDGLENRFLTLMNSANRFERRGERLTLTGQEGQLVFVRAGHPAPAASLNGRWRLSRLSERGVAQPLPGTPLTLNLEGTRLSGFSGCNSFGGALTVQGASFRAGQLLSTMRACANEQVNASERRYLSALGAVNTFSLRGNLLTLSSPAGDRLTFTRLP